MNKIYVIHENDEWVGPLRNAFTAQGLPFDEWFVADGITDLDSAPPQGVFYNRMSASSHTRGHRFAPEQAGVLLAWLEAYGRRLVNGTRALQLEISKAAQYAALNSCGIRTPRTILGVGRNAVVAAAEALGPGRLILKPNRGGSGRGVRQFETAAALRDFVESDGFEEPLDGLSLVQEYIDSAEQHITRVEFIGGRFLYAVRVDTGGSFELCPADPCAIPDVDEATAGSQPSFTILDSIDDGLVRRYERFLSANEIEIAAIEFAVAKDGEPVSYDVNTNTNYNSHAEQTAGRFGMTEIARFLGSELARLSRNAA